MSKKSLGLFVHRLHQELEGYKEYRSLMNLEQHTFVFNKRTLVAQTLAQLKKGGSEIPPDIRRKMKIALTDLANKHGDLLIAKLEEVAKTKLHRPGGKVTLVFSSDTTIPLPDYYKMDALDLPVFARVKIVYREIINNYFKDMQLWLAENAEEYLAKNKDGSTKGSTRFFFDAGHEEGYGVFERFIDQATLNIAKGLEQSTDSDSEAARARIINELKDLGFELDIAKSDSTDSIVIKIESTYLNRSRGSQTSKRSKTLRAAVLKFIEANPLADLEGSDSIKTRKRKKAIKAILDPFKKLKSVKVTSEDIKIKLADTKTKKAPASTIKSSKAAVGKLQGLKARKIKRTARPATSMLQMIGIINAQLPSTLQKNMMVPRLENRTGRFANSVEVTDITKTPKGYPSIGYTYQKFPYQTFEPGFKQGSVERDPRKLIDTSIREIAAKLAIGRFYTRRL